MAWTSPMTAVAGSVFTAAQFNTNVRDNLNQTAPALAVTAGQIFVSTGASAVASRTPSQALIAANETSTSTSYTNLATPGPSVTVTTGTQALVGLYANLSNSSTANTVMGFAVSGSTTMSPDDSYALTFLAATGSGVNMSAFNLVTGLGAGINTFAAQYKVSGGTGRWINRRLLVIPL